MRREEGKAAASMVTGLGVWAVVVILPLGSTACCGDGAFDRNVVISHVSGLEVGRDPTAPLDPDEPLGPNRTPLPRFAIRIGDTATFNASAEETYFGDSGCTPAGPLGPSSGVEPERFTWSSGNPNRVSARADGQVRGLEVGETLIGVEHRNPEVSGRAVIRVLPWFDSVTVQATRDSVRVGDTISVLATALTQGAAVPGVTFNTAGLGLVFDPSSALVNSVFSQLDQSPVQYVMIAQTPGVVIIRPETRVVSFGPALGLDSILVIDGTP